MFSNEKGVCEIVVCRVEESLRWAGEPPRWAWEADDERGNRLQWAGKAVSAGAALNARPTENHCSERKWSYPL